MVGVVVVLNPVAGGGAAGRVVPGLVARIGRPVDLFVTERAGDAARLAARAAEEGAERLVVAGGDGTVREAAEGLLRGGPRGAEGPVLGLLPFGNANVLARELAIPRERARALDLALRGEGHPLDVGRADGRAFLCMVGVGIDARVAERVDRMRRRPLGRRAYRVAADCLYALGALAEIAKGPGPLVRLRADGIEPVQATSLVAANTASYARCGRLGPDVLPADGRLNVFVPPAANRAGELRFLMGLALRGRVPAVAALARFRLDARSAFPVQLDGDPIGKRNLLDVEIEPSALRVAAPTTAPRRRAPRWPATPR